MSHAVQDPEPQTEARQGDTALVPSPQADAPLTRTGAMGFGLVPRNFDEAWRLASILAKSKLVPKNYAGEPEDVIVAMQYGAEIGLPPMASLQSVAVINGKPGIYGDGFLGVIMSKPAYAKHAEYYVLHTGETVKSLRQEDYQHDETRAVSMFWRRGNPDPFVGEFSIGDAKRAKLWGKEGPWTTYPARQLRWRARGFAGRDAFAGELRGVKMAEELLDTPDDGDALRPIPPPEPIRRSEKAQAAAQAPAAAESAAADVEEIFGPDDHASEAAEPQPAELLDAPTKPARPAPSTPDPARSSGAPTGTATVLPHAVITETAYVQPKGQPPYYEVKARVQAKGKAPIGYVFTTRDEALYKLAESCEGTDTPFTITWKAGKRLDGSACKVIVSLAAAD